VEILDPRWSRVQLTTAAEEHPGGKQLIRCRLRGRWSFRASLAFWALLGMIFLAIGLSAGKPWWVWLLLGIPAALAWYLRRSQRTLQSIVIVLLDKLARDRGLVKLEPGHEKPRGPVEPAAPPSTPIPASGPEVVSPVFEGNR
jgi:hypothetical protein